MENMMIVVLFVLIHHTTFFVDGILDPTIRQQSIRFSSSAQVNLQSCCLTSVRSFHARISSRTSLGLMRLRGGEPTVLTGNQHANENGSVQTAEESSPAGLEDNDERFSPEIRAYHAKLMDMMMRAKSQEEADDMFMDHMLEPFEGKDGEPDDFLEALHKQTIECPVCPTLASVRAYTPPR